ncbi:MAG: DUF309 domain-containing protein [Polyangiaceae bacterium]
MTSRAELFQKGIDAYRSGDHYEAHELWEELWQDEGDETRHRVLQALIQIASAVHKAVHDVAPRGSLRLVDRAQERLADVPDVFLGLDVAALRGALPGFRTAVEEAMDEQGRCRIAAELAPPLSQRAVLATWSEVPTAPAVPAGAQSAWFERGLGAYAQGEYFEAHELWEELWRDHPEGPDRQFLQGLIQVAAAMHKAVTQDMPAPAARLLGRALLRLEAAPADHWGIDVARLVREAQRSRQGLARHASARRPAPSAGEEPASLPPLVVPTIARGPALTT